MNSITAFLPGLLNRNPIQLMTRYLQLTVSTEAQNYNSHCVACGRAGRFGSTCMSEGLGEFTVEVVSHFLCRARSPLITSVVQLC